MAELPEYLQPFKEEAELYIRSGKVREVEFSKSTYQVLVEDAVTGIENWTFLQFDKNDELTDCFCSHEEAEGFVPCVHLCAAFMQLLNAGDELLHERFERSLWNKLCFIYAERLGASPRMLVRQSKGIYTYTSASGKEIFRVEALTREANTRLKNEILKRTEVSEETSLKFSNLSQEELKLWREGRPPAQLSYELSFWSDLAKWAMLLQEHEGPYKTSYGYSSLKGSAGLPNFLTVTFSSLSLSFYLSEATLISIIPALNTIDSELKAFQPLEEDIARIEYDKVERTFIVIPEERKSSSEAMDTRMAIPGGIPCGKWIFQPHVGFFRFDPHPLLSQGKVHDIEGALNDHLDVLKKRLVEAAIHDEEIPLLYALHFDADWNLHISSYLSTPGDLTNSASMLYGNWAYIDDDGFYRLETHDFHQLETIVKMEELPRFIANHRVWLNAQKGFSLHLSGMESELAYTLSPDNVLSFHPTTAYKEKKKGSFEFDSWIYIPGEGFYAKKSSAMPNLTKTGITWNEAQIPIFIKMNEKELELITGFFSDISPVRHCRLVVELHHKDKLLAIQPEYQLKESYRNREVKFFDEYSYVAGEGFCEIPSGERLPERYRHVVYIAEDQLNAFVKEDLDALLPHVSRIDKELQRPQSMTLEVVSLEQRPEGGYLASLRYLTDIGHVSATHLWRDIKKKLPYSFTPAGLIDLADGRFHWLRWLKRPQIRHQQQQIALSTLELLRLLAFEDIDVGSSKGSYATTEMLKKMLDFSPSEIPSLSGLRSTLRPYQLNGLRWLWFLRSFDLSGLLCDDMGLGKTHQAMALVAAIREKRATSNSTESRPFLIICPTSVIYHWQEKLQQYLPDIKVYTYYGAERTLADFHEKYDLLLTSYGICRIENNLLKEIPFDLAIFDEVQIAKNHNSRVYAALAALQVNMRLGLTGTPIENHLRELKALFDLVLPLYMPSEVEFRELFVKPIEKERSPKQTKLLERLIKPFVLRRKKEDVLFDLPDKIEEVSHCDLAPTQQALYNEVLLLGRSQIMEEMESGSGHIPYVHIFALLSALKRICDHPALYLKQTHNYKEYESGKWELFVELLAEARESGQKVVVYSQYLGMLDIIQHYLVECGIEFAGIRGSTIDRREELKKFQTNPKCEVFIASLQAAGLGIDLTAASVVIHYDRWWNAARENQATDRVHRIGQKKGVQVFKLVTKDTFEERIDELIKRKAELAESIVAVDEQESIKQFTAFELMELLKEAKGAQKA
jgi:superfamily II DNA or RNA helicase